MGQEIERKFLLAGDGWREGAQGVHYRQGYLSTHPDRNVRVRTKGEKATLTIKGRTTGISRSEYEYAIPVDDARSLLDELCEKPLIEKVRYTVDYGGLEWVIDEFEGENEGLLLAEVELESEGQVVELPPWIGEEVSDDLRYYNANLVTNPFCRW
jgi:CYTH domain-containing protein